MQTTDLNQAEHLDQAGEAEDFKNVIADENAPKGIFPWFIPGAESFLATNPLSHCSLYHNGEAILQPEPEIALVAELHYATENNKLVDGLTVLGFTAFNDCSRRTNEPKISFKKNWGTHSQGIAKSIIPINDFNQAGGTIDQYRLLCYLRRDGKLHQYGKDTAVADYCYSNQTLVNWITEQINTQTDFGPLESIRALLTPRKPRYVVIGIGATCYTPFGNSSEKFLRESDEIIVAVYNSNTQNQESVEARIANGSASTDGLLLLAQKATCTPKLPASTLA